MGGHPGDRLTQAVFEPHGRSPAEGLAGLGAVEGVSGVLARTIVDNIDHAVEVGAEQVAEGFHQSADTDEAFGGKVVALAGGRGAGDAEGGAGHIVDVDKGPHRVAAAMEREALAKFDREQRARDDAVELLAGAVDVGGAGPDHRETVVGKKGAQVQVAGGTGGGVRRARVKGRVLGDDAGGGAVHLGRAHVNVFFQPGAAAQCLVQAQVGHDVGLVPMLGIEPALGDHALGGKVDHHRRGKSIERGHQAVGIGVEIGLHEAPARLRLGGQPAVGQKTRRRLVRTA